MPGERLRLEAYKKLAAVQDEAGLADIDAELVDRYGPMPEPVQVLMEVARLRTIARAAGVADIGVQGNRIRFAPVELRDSQRLRLERLYRGTIIKPAIRQILVPAPKTAPVGGRLPDEIVLHTERPVIGRPVDGTGSARRVREVHPVAAAGWRLRMVTASSARASTGISRKLRYAIPLRPTA